MDLQKKIFFLTLCLVGALSSCSTRRTTSPENPKNTATTPPAGNVKTHSPQELELPGEGVANNDSSLSPEPGVISVPIADGPERIGVILGPGAAATQIHAGFLQELIKAKLPIVGIVGLEMAALPGFLAAQKGEPFRAQWTAIRMPQRAWPTATRKWDRKSLQGFLREIGVSVDLTKSAIPFACPVFQLRSQKAALLAKGRANDVLTYCLSHPENLSPAFPTVAALDEVELSARWLRAKGAQQILFVDVIGALSKESLVTQWWWGSLRSHLRAESERLQVQWLAVQHDLPMSDFGRTKDFIGLGIKAGQAWQQSQSQQGAP